MCEFGRFMVKRRWQVLYKMLWEKHMFAGVLLAYNAVMESYTFNYSEIACKNSYVRPPIRIYVCACVIICVCVYVYSYLIRK